jgi:hypothetical protein
MVITVVAIRDVRGVQRGATAWRARGASPRQYRELEQEPERGDEDD